MNSIVLSVLVVGGAGLLIGLLLGIAGKKFEVKTDERITAVREALPGNNCGGCGYPGCDGVAEAIVNGQAPVTACPVGGAEVAKKIGKIMGEEVADAARMTAFVKCEMCIRDSCESAASQRRISCYRIQRQKSTYIVVIVKEKESQELL